MKWGQLLLPFCREGNGKFKGQNLHLTTHLVNKVLTVLSFDSKQLDPELVTGWNSQWAPVEAGRGAGPRAGSTGGNIQPTPCVHPEVLKLLSFAGNNQTWLSPKVVDLGSVFWCLETVIRLIVCHPGRGGSKGETGCIFAKKVGIRILSMHGLVRCRQGRVLKLPQVVPEKPWILKCNKTSQYDSLTHPGRTQAEYNMSFTWSHRLTRLEAFGQAGW